MKNMSHYLPPFWAICHLFCSFLLQKRGLKGTKVGGKLLSDGRLETIQDDALLESKHGEAEKVSKL